MKLVKSLSRNKKKESELLKDIKEDGYHVFSLQKARIPNYYPQELPIFPGVSIKNIGAGDIITIRIFFGIGKGRNLRIIHGEVAIDLQVEEIRFDSVMATILTVLPKNFLLIAGGWVEIFEDEILYKAESRYH